LERQTILSGSVVDASGDDAMVGILFVEKRCGKIGGSRSAYRKICDFVENQYLCFVATYKLKGTMKNFLKIYIRRTWLDSRVEVVHVGEK